METQNQTIEERLKESEQETNRLRNLSSKKKELVERFRSVSYCPSSPELRRNLHWRDKNMDRWGKRYISDEMVKDTIYEGLRKIREYIGNPQNLREEKRYFLSRDALCNLYALVDNRKLEEDRYNSFMLEKDPELGHIQKRIRKQERRKELWDNFKNYFMKGGSWNNEKRNTR